MVSIWLTRLAISRTLFNFFGYLSPALNSTKAIVNKDEEGIREYLTYWCVFGLLLYVEFILNFFSIVRSWPPETRVLFILWLTLPQFQGAFRIYTFVLLPYFEKYEDEIDKQISSISRKSVKIAHRHVKTILWQVFLAPNDGLFTAALSLSSLSSENILSLSSFLYQQDKMLVDVPENVEQQIQQAPSTEKRSTSQSLSRQLLESFTVMLLDGIYADVRHSYSDTSRAYHHSPLKDMQVCKVSLVLSSYYLELVRQAPDDSEKEESFIETEGKGLGKNREDGNKLSFRNSKSIDGDEYIDDCKGDPKIFSEDRKVGKNEYIKGRKGDKDECIKDLKDDMDDCAESSRGGRNKYVEDSKGDRDEYIEDNTDSKDFHGSYSGHGLRSFLVPLFLVTGVSSDRYDPNLITIIFTSPSPSVSSPYTRIPSLRVDIYQTRMVYMKAEDAEEGDVLLAGMSVLCADSKKRATLTISRAVHLLSKTLLSIAFEKWTKFPTI